MATALSPCEVCPAFRPNATASPELSLTVVPFVSVMVPVMILPTYKLFHRFVTFPKLYVTLLPGIMLLVTAVQVTLALAVTPVSWLPLPTKYCALIVLNRYPTAPISYTASMLGFILELA